VCIREEKGILGNSGRCMLRRQQTQICSLVERPKGLRLYIIIYMVKTKFSRPRGFVFLEADISITICVASKTGLDCFPEKYACFAYVDHQTLGHDRKKLHPKKNRKKFSRYVDVSDYVECKSAIEKIAKQNTPQATFQSRFLFVFYHMYMYVYIYIYIW
jgi:hypothetical protein